MDRSIWMYEIPRFSEDFLFELSEFMKVAENDRLNKRRQKICCPCKRCMNSNWLVDPNVVSGHIVQYGFVDGYLCWSWHGEQLVDKNIGVSECNQVDIDENNDFYNNDDCDNVNSMLHNLEADVNENDNGDFQKLFIDAEKPLYNGCTKFTKLSAVLKLLNLKANNSWSDTSFTSLLVLLHDMLPEDNELPISLYYAKKMVCLVGLEIERIPACPNDCLLYRNEYKHDHKCAICGTSRYMRKNQTELNDDVTKNGPPAKVLWYFPIIPRLKRLFANPRDAKLLRWHEEGRKKDGKIRHVDDSPQWRNIDSKFKDFGKEVRNIRFGLSSDEINPFGNMSSSHSTWPVLLCVYNLPPWLCMKRKYIMMSLLIQGPKQPGNDIDVYLAPLVEDLKKLWSPGVEVRDTYTNEIFRLRAIIFCTISDFPAYGNLSGYGTKGAKACPHCEDDTSSRWLTHCRKTVFMGHRRSLHSKHPYRLMANLFDGSTESRSLRPPMDGETVFSQVENFNNAFGKKRKPVKPFRWKKRSILWEFEHWKYLDVRHCIDVMHIEKNVCDSLIGLLLNIKGKSKDGVEYMVVLDIVKLLKYKIKKHSTKNLPSF